MTTVALHRSWSTVVGDAWLASREARWIRRAQAGDEQAFRRLYQDLYPVVWRFVNRRLHNPAEAEDVTSAVFFTWLERIASFDANKGSVRAWILTIARHRVIDHVRSRKPSTPLPDDAPAPLEDALTALIHKESLEAVRALLRECSEEVRELLGLRFIDELSFRDIAQVLGISEATAKQRASRALRGLESKAAEAALKTEVEHG